MKAFGILVLVLILSLLSTAHADETPASICPMTDKAETILDCPWAAIARDLALATDSRAALSRLAPDFAKRLRREGRIAGDVKKLWGRSINFDENVKGTIIPEPIIDAVLSIAGVPPRDARIVHAGFEHTYGYLLSNLRTPYGYKRLRWVRPDIEIGFGLEPGVISPTPNSGGFFMNVSYFAGRIAFRGDSKTDLEARRILRNAKGVARSLRRIDYSYLHGRRLTETVALSKTRIIELRTDFVPFVQLPAGGNSELLVYSIRDSAEAVPQLITAFPVAPGFSDGAFNPKNLGEGKPIITRYNAFVADLTDSKAPLVGRREATEF